MKKKVFLLLIFIISFFIIYTNVYADLTCSNSVTIKESSPADSTGWRTIIPVVGRWEFDHYSPIGSGGNYPDTLQIGTKEIQVYYRSIDNKGTVPATIPMCTNELRYITAKVEFYVDYCSSVKSYVEESVTCSESDCSSTTEDSPYCKWKWDYKYVWNEEKQKNERVKVEDSKYCGRNSVKKYKKDANGNKYIEEYKCDKDDSVLTSRSNNSCVHEKTANDGHYVCVRTITFTTPNECEEDGYVYDYALGKQICRKATSAAEAQQAIGQRKVVKKTSQDTIDYYAHQCNWGGGVPFEGALSGCINDQNATNPVRNKIEYTFYCPVFKPITYDANIATCTPTFKVGNTETTAYCINPSNPFSVNGNTQEKYQVLSDFNVNDCATSYSTRDCGYANIMIEGKSKKYSDKEIETAMRLWGVHTGAAGFNNGTGLSLKSGTTCNKYEYYSYWSDKKLYNVYKQTYNYAKKEFYQKLLSEISSIDYQITCNSLKTVRKKNGEVDYVIMDASEATRKKMYGVMCGAKTSYEKAFELLFSTILGNDKMQEQLANFYGGLNNEPDYAEIYTSEGKNYIATKFQNEEYSQIFEKSGLERIPCNASNQIYKDHEAEIKPFCQTTSIAIGPNGEIDRGTQLECTKEIGCIRITTAFAQCQIANESKKVKQIKVTYKSSGRDTSIRKYVSCGPTGSQQMFAFFEPGANRGTVNDKSNQNKILTKSFDVPSVTCDLKNLCDDSSISVDLKKLCNKPVDGKTDKENNYNGYFTSTIKDPSLRCITNLNSSSNKLLYEYSDLFHVNRDICRVYCSDEVEYHIADKVKYESKEEGKDQAKSGRYFKYQIKVAGSGFEHEETPLLAVIKEKRTCVSQIFFKTSIPDDSIAHLRKVYGLSEEELKSGDTFRHLLVALRNKAVGSNDADVEVGDDEYKGENSRGENVNQIVYDLLNCNFYKPNDPIYKDVYKPKDNTYGNSYNYIDKEFGVSNNYGLYAKNNSNGINSCEINQETGINTCFVHEPITYEYGSLVDGKEVNVSSTLDIKTFKGEVKYCNNKKGDCFSYDNNNKKNYSYGNSVTENLTYNQGFYNIDTPYDYLKLPQNDYAYFDVSAEIGFYNSSEFKVEPITGKVYNKAPDYEKYMDLEKYTFPLDYDAQNIYKLSEGNICEYVDAKTTRCEIEHKISTSATFFRNNDNDSFVNAIKQANSFVCYVDIDVPEPEPCPDGISTVCPYTMRYRNVDPSNLFPSSTPDNWSTVEGVKAKEYIESNAEELKYDKDMIDYSITLSPSQIKAIKEYNKTAESYRDERMDLSTCVTNSNDKNKQERYLNCESVFLRELKSNKKFATINIDNSKKYKSKN